MQEIVFYAILAGCSFLGSIFFFSFGLIKKKKPLIILSIVFLIGAIIAGVVSAYGFATKSYSKVSKLVEPRSGEEVYIALFGAPLKGCVTVENYKDQLIPKIDYAIWLHFNTCSKEIDRVLSSREYAIKKIAVQEVNTFGPSKNDQWFNPQLLGDSILVFTCLNEHINQTIYCNVDSTEAYCIDILE